MTIRFYTPETHAVLVPHLLPTENTAHHAGHVLAQMALGAVLEVPATDATEHAALRSWGALACVEVVPPLEFDVGRPLVRLCRR